VEWVGHDPSKLAEKMNVLVDSSAAQGLRARHVWSSGRECAIAVPHYRNVKVPKNPYVASDRAGVVVSNRPRGVVNNC
jgi:hypothetical protein